MITFSKHGTALCPDCGASLVYGTKQEPAGWKVYYECNDRCGFEQMAGWVKLSEITHLDDVQARAEAMGDRWSDRNDQE
ncbi:hypothetical protein [Halolamina rubra]|uniref:hypothetical protein n=1 Tax=Halolamina rubra TaxID=1380430 RepID=UPI0012AB7E1E|nr:hypothetical protein [Halolamina rubra]